MESVLRAKKIILVENILLSHANVDEVLNNSNYCISKYCTSNYHIDNYNCQALLLCFMRR